MTDAAEFGRVVLIVAVGFAVAILSSRISGHLRVPAPALFLAAATVSSDLIPNLAPLLTIHDVERICLVALIVILFDGGMDIGVTRFRQSLWPIVSLGVVGTFLVAGLLAVLVHVLFGPSWTTSLLIGAALAPTDPAVVFSVLGGSEVSGRSDDILKGESGVNDPVGIALVIGLLDITSNSGSSLSIAEDFALQMAVGLAVGVLGGRALLVFMRRVALPSEGLYSLRTLASCLMLYGIATLAHGSGFLAVFVAGIVIGDARAPYKPEIKRFHTALAGLAEIVAFAVLGLTVDLNVLGHPDVWVCGLVLAVALTVLIRPLAVGSCLIPVRLQRNERTFVLFAGLKGAVPILLGEFLRAAHLPDAERLYGIVVIVVVFSVLVQGSSVPGVARLLHLPMRTVETLPWQIGVRLADEPRGVHRFSVATGSVAERSTVEGLGERVGDIWVSIVVRATGLVPVRGETELEAGDEVVILADPELHDTLAELFGPAQAR